MVYNGRPLTTRVCIVDRMSISAATATSEGVLQAEAAGLH